MIHGFFRVVLMVLCEVVRVPIKVVRWGTFPRKLDMGFIFEGQ